MLPMDADWRNHGSVRVCARSDFDSVPILTQYFNKLKRSISTVAVLR